MEADLGLLTAQPALCHDAAWEPEGGGTGQTSHPNSTGAAEGSVGALGSLSKGDTLGQKRHFHLSLDSKAKDLKLGHMNPVIWG